MNIYQANIATLQEESNQLSKKDIRISLLRLVNVISIGILAYQFYVNADPLVLAAELPLVILFIYLIKWHQKIKWQNQVCTRKIELNKQEDDYLENKNLSFQNGEQFSKSDHEYSYDLDFFGEKSLYQHLNRTQTYFGGQKLASGLLRILKPPKLLEEQEAIKELRNELSWRQELAAVTSIQLDSKEVAEKLLQWSEKPIKQFNTITKAAIVIFPVLTITFFSIHLAAYSDLFWRLGLLSLLVNFGLLGTFVKSIREELVDTSQIEKILKQYAGSFRLIEEKDFSSKKLIELKRKTVSGRTKASYAIGELSALFGQLEHVTNAFASPVLNGLFLFHVHTLRNLSTWREKHGSQIKDWLDVLGEFEKVSSLSNFSYNNHDYTFPEINEEQNIFFEDAGHPLLSNQNAVTNTIDFTKQRFIILTGSNMSGKSTFLRTLGVNLVLGSIGAPVFAKKATIHPLPVLVSMRLSDSLSDSESYFYAEVKRLKSIMERLKVEPCFVLLDEILRGTNSDDKRSGTIEVIRKLAKMDTYGGIATHDLEVCETQAEFPKVLANKRFEVEIIHNDLRFDYQLRDGICENKSASFIMKKMGVI